MIKKLLFAATAFAAISFGANAQTVVSQTGNSAPTDTTVACAVGTPAVGISESTYFRSYTMSSNLSIGAVRVGVGAVNGDFPVTVTVYQSAGAFPGSYPDGLTELGSGTATFTSADDLSLVDVQLSSAISVNSGDVIVVGVHNINTAVAEGGNGSTHYMGVATSETNPSYLLAEGCGLTTPSTFASIGFTDAFIIIDIVEADASTENFDKLGLNVFPNPVNDIVNITSPEANIEAITITDLNGRTVKSFNFTNVAETTVDASDLSSGIYLLNITANGTVATQKIVKK